MKVQVLKLNNTIESVDLDITKEFDLTNLSTDVAVLNRVKNQAQKQGTKGVRDRSEVRGHAKKPYRQKGTGGARQGSTKGPHYRGGGIAHGPTMDTTSLRLNKKHKVATLKKVLFDSMSQSTFKFVDFSATETASLRKLIDLQPRTLFVYAVENKDSARALRNLSHVEVLSFDKLNPFTLISYKNIIADLTVKSNLESMLNS